MSRRDDACPEDARAFARWDSLGCVCEAHEEAEFTSDGECIECLRRREEEQEEYLAGIEYDRQEERGIDAWRGLDD